MLAGSGAGANLLAVVDRLLAVQAQELRGARLAIRARTRGLSARDLDRALTADRSLVISWLNRGTLHLIASADFPWLHALTTPQLLTANGRRLGQEGVSPAAAERGLAALQRSLSREGPLTRGQLGERIAAARVPTRGQALVHILMLASLRGLVVRGPMIGAEHAYVLVSDWLGEVPAVDRGQALAELARRYLAGHGPADDRDLARWAGVTLRDARAGLNAIAPELERPEDGLLALRGREPPAELPAPLLLGPYEPVLLGWRSREQLLGSHQGVVTTNGLFRPFALVRGRAAATWRLRQGEVAIEPFTRLTGPESEALGAEAQDVLRYLGGA
jgi:hypothetical protein